MTEIFADRSSWLPKVCEMHQGDVVRIVGGLGTTPIKDAILAMNAQGLDLREYRIVDHGHAVFIDRPWSQRPAWLERQ